MATTVWCLVINYRYTPVGTPFNVFLENDRDCITDLKEKVKEGKKPDLDRVDADQLIVWRSKEPKLLLDAKMEDIKALIKAIDFLGGTNVVELGSADMIKSLELENETLLVEMPPDKSDHWQQVLYNEIYEKAWGRAWPHHEGVINKTWDVDEGARMQIDDEPSPGSAGGKNPTSWEYVCLDGIKAVGRALGMTTHIPPKVVIRDEYEYVRLALERMAGPVDMGKFDAIVLLGQRGIGKTIFLLYLLLYRLERRLPTAIQLIPEEYIVFHKAGVDLFGPHDYTELLSSDCWALSDSNSVLISPSAKFLASEASIVQAANPRRDRWKGWSKQRHAKQIIMDLPHPFEIAAIACANFQLPRLVLFTDPLPYTPPSLEAGFEPANALIIMRTWGPVTRTIMGMLADPTLSVRQGEEARAAANKVAERPSITMRANIDEVTTFASALLFIRPVRSKNDYGGHVLDIPTPTLAGIFNDARAQLSNRDLSELYAALSSHSLTRAGPGWVFEQTMHVYMTRGVEPLDLLPGGKIQPTTNVLSGSVDALRTEESDSFYWFPSVVSLEGIDAVLGNNGDIYALQATIAGEHTSPIEGLGKVWHAIHPSAREKRWYFVVITDDDAKAQHYLYKITKRLTLGDKKVPVNVCTCLLSAEHRKIIL